MEPLKPVGEVRGPKRFVGLWCLGASVLLHAVALVPLLWRQGAATPASPARSSPAATRILLFDARDRSGPGSRAGPSQPQAVAVPPAEREPVRAWEPRAARAAGPGQPLREVPAASKPLVRAATTHSEGAAVAPPPTPAPVAEVTVGPAAPAPGGGEAVGTGPVAAEGEVAGGAPASEGSGGRAKGGGTGADARALDALHRRLAEAALRCYPPSARRFRAQGEVVVTFCLDETGRATSVAQVTGSGSVLLDRAALDCVVPGALPAPGVSGCYTVPVGFRAIP